MNEIKYKNLTLYYSEDDGGYTVCDCDKDAVSVEIPEYIDGVAVVAIAESAFENCTELVSVSFPDYSDDFYINGYSFDSIGDGAFSDCKSLVQIELPYSVSFIGRSAFYGCVSLKSISFCEKAYVAPYAFAKCTALEEVPMLRLVSEGCFSHCQSLGFAPLSESCTEIGEDAFEHCDSLSEIVIPASVSEIGSLAFRGCKGLKSVAFGNPEGWYYKSAYKSGEFSLDLEDSAKNAERLSKMDFDDGVMGLYRKGN